MFRPFRSFAVAAVVALAICAASVAPALAQQPQGRPRVAVLNFENNSTWAWWGDRLGEAAADELVTQLIKTGNFTVIERAQLAAIMAEQKLGATGAVDSSTAARIGKLLGVQYILTGSITQFSVKRTGGAIRAFGGIGASVTNAEARLDVRLVSTETGEILVAAEGQGNRRMGGGSFRGTGGEQQFEQGAAQEALRPAVEQVVATIAQQAGTLRAAAPAAPGGQVVGLKDKLVYVNRGQGAGVKVGQRFNVSRVTDEIKDADGRVLDRVISQVAVIEVTQVLSQSAVCRIVSGDVRVNDTIE
jgi:curli biogenesis system outer membrane secretion channel CsgG